MEDKGSIATNFGIFSSDQCNETRYRVIKSVRSVEKYLEQPPNYGVRSESMDSIRFLESSAVRISSARR